MRFLQLVKAKKSRPICKCLYMQKTAGARAALATEGKQRVFNRARRQSGFPTFISCQRQDANVLPKRRQSHQGDKLCDVSTVPLVARWPVFLARGSDADGEPHCDVVRWVVNVQGGPRMKSSRQTMKADYQQLASPRVL